MDFKNNLTYYRERAGLTQGELADKIGISQAAINQLEKGKTNPRPITVKALAKLFRVSEDVLRGTKIKKTKGAK